MVKTTSNARKWVAGLTGVSGAAVLILGMTASGISAAEIPTSVKALFPAAQAEGTLFVFGRSVKPRQNKAFQKAISKFYGFTIKLKMKGGSHNQKAAQVMLSVKNNVPTNIDIFWTSYNTSVRLEKANAFRKFDWTGTFGLPKTLKSSEYGLRSHDVSLFLVSYNTKQVKAADRPKSYEDLLNPKWKGKIAMPRTTTPWIYLTRAIGEDKATSLLTRILDKQNVKILPRFSNIRSAVASGEFAIGIGSDAFVQIRKGAPVAHAKMTPMPVSAWGFHILKDAKNPNLAKLWGYWIATPDGQNALKTIDALARVTTEGGELWKLAQNNEIKTLTRAYIAKNGKRLSIKYKKIIGIR